MMRTTRIAEMEAYILEKEIVSLEELCREFSVSMSTLRRDLLELLPRGNVAKVYGGVQKIAGPLIPFHARSCIETEAKTAVCALAARLVKDGEVLFLDSGSTACNLIEHLSHLRQVTVITNNLDAVLRAIPHPNINLYMLTGSLNRANNSISCLTPDALLQDYNIDTAFMAASGLSLQGRVSHSDALENPLKKAALRHAARAYLLVDHTKFGRGALQNYARVRDFRGILTDRPPGEEYVALLENEGVPLVYNDKLLNNC